MVPLREFQQSTFEEMGEPCGRTTISAVLYQSGLFDKVTKWKSLLSEKLLTGLSMKNKIPWADEAKIEIYGLNTKRLVETRHLLSPG